MAILGIEGIAESFNVDESLVEQAVKELEADWDNWVEWWEKKELPEGLAAVPIVWSPDFKEAVESLVGKDADIMLKLKVAITLDSMVS